MNSIAQIERYPVTAWTWNHPGPVKIGSEEHKSMFCRMLLDTFDPYKPAELEWPELTGDALARITGMPFWTVAVETEDKASVHVAKQAAQTSDPLIREAIELMAFEEARHQRVLAALVARYGIVIEKFPPYVPTPRTEWNFMSTGYGECLDSFFAFGLFELANRSGYFPPELVETFEPVVQEEARHLMFFVNWVAYTQANLPMLAKPWFGIKRLIHLASNGLSRLGFATGEEDFAATGKDSVGIDIDLGAFVDLCLSENARRMGQVDPRLVRPTILPTTVRALRRFIPG
ncbi:MAG: ferritin-like domain-containing protein [Rhodospirillaceae bacterium]|nr:MAG: ferritin-like domain-containing protein [Rhodospirillaceae bacterium]